MTSSTIAHNCETSPGIINAEYRRRSARHKSQSRESCASCSRMTRWRRSVAIHCSARVATTARIHTAVISSFAVLFVDLSCLICRLGETKPKTHKNKQKSRETWSHRARRTAPHRAARHPLARPRTNSGRTYCATPTNNNKLILLIIRMLVFNSGTLSSSGHFKQQ